MDKLTPEQIGAVRATSTEVDLALMISQLDSPTASNAAKLLAVEVQALRAELEALALAGVADLLTEFIRRGAALARVQQLAQQYDEEAHPYAGDKIRAALKEPT